MSLLFTSGSSNNVNVGTAQAVLPDVCTILAWIYPTSVAAGYRSLYERTSSDFADYRGIGINNTTGEIGAFIRRGSPAFTGVDLSKQNILVANAWQFVGAQMDATSALATAQKIFYGTRSQAAAEVTAYNKQNAGSGATSSIANVPAYVGNTTGLAGGFPGRIGWIGVWNRVLTLGEIVDQQFRSQKTAGCEGMWNFYGASSMTDLSGNQRNGVLSGATADAHIPV